MQTDKAARPCKKPATIRNVLLAVCMTALAFSGTLNYWFMTGKFRVDSDSFQPLWQTAEVQPQITPAVSHKKGK